MPRRSTLTLSGRAVDGLSVSEKDAIFWDRELAGFGVRVYPSGAQGLRRPEPGPGRAEARHPRHPRRAHRNPGAAPRAAQVIDRIKRGEEPNPPPAQAGVAPSPTSPSAT